MVYYYLHIYIGLFKITGRDAYGGIGEGMHMWNRWSCRVGWSVSIIWLCPVEYLISHSRLALNKKRKIQNWHFSAKFPLVLENVWPCLAPSCLQPLAKTRTAGTNPGLGVFSLAWKRYERALWHHKGPTCRAVHFIAHQRCIVDNIPNMELLILRTKPKNIIALSLLSLSWYFIPLFLFE